jgi:hypothetical protein
MLKQVVYMYVVRWKFMKKLFSKVQKGKAIPVQTWTGPDVSRRLRLPDFQTIGTCRW